MSRSDSSSKNSSGSGQGKSSNNKNNNNDNTSSQSDYSILKDSYGGRRPTFQASYGLSMMPEDLDEGKAILSKMKEYDSKPSKK